jgi:mycothiol synthase
MSLPHGNPAAEAFLRAVDFQFHYNLQQMRLDPGMETLPPSLPDGFVLRTFKEDDFDRYFALLNQSFADHPTPIEVPEERMREVHSRPDFDPSLIALVERVAEPGEFAAFILLRTPAVENGVLSGSIGMIGVDPAYRRLGLGRQMMRWAIQRLREMGCQEITLEVVEMNDRALPLYEQEGFRHVQDWPYWKPVNTRQNPP